MSIDLGVAGQAAIDVLALTAVRAQVAEVFESGKVVSDHRAIADIRLNGGPVRLVEPTDVVAAADIHLREGGSCYRLLEDAVDPGQGAVKWPVRADQQAAVEPEADVWEHLDERSDQDLL